MIYSRLEEVLKEFVHDKNLDWLPSRHELVSRLNEELDSGKINLDDAMIEIRANFHKDVINDKIDEADLRKIGHQLGINMRKG
jgi:hypothetical protein